MFQIAYIKAISGACDTLQNYDPVSEHVEVDQFQKRNLIYGYNASGKTTISRIFSFLGAGDKPDGLGDNFDFKIVLRDGDTEKTVTRTSADNELLGRVFVYNEDYVEDNFDWNDATARPILGLGKASIDTQKKLTELREKTEKLGHEKAAAEKNLKRSGKALDGHLQQAARTVEEGARLASRSFTARQLKPIYEDPDYDVSSAPSPDQYKKAQQTLDQAGEIKDLGTQVDWPETLVSTVCRNFIPLMPRTAIQEKIPELDEHRTQETWAHEGYQYHSQNHLKNCLLCGNAISKDRFDNLAKHFSKEVNAIAAEARDLEMFFAAAQNTLSGLPKTLPDPLDLVPVLREEYKALLEELDTPLSQGLDVVNGLVSAIKKKREAPATSFEIDVDALTESLSAWQTSFQEWVQAVEKILVQNKQAGQTRDEDRKQAQQIIRDYLLAQAHPRFVGLNDQKQGDDTICTELTTEEARLKNEIKSLEASLQDHAAGAEHIDKEVAAFLHHSGITMTPVHGGYELTRDGTPVRKLSEGEKTAITFCHFVTSLIGDDRKLEDLIVVVDDPISSLDTRSLTYMNGLIQYKLQNAHQLFIFTHNLTFLSQIKKWIVSNNLVRKASEAAKNNKPKIPLPAYQLHVLSDLQTGQRRALLENMSKLLRDYEGEYHYLFSLVYCYAQQDKPLQEQMLLLPNAIRKVLETFVSFKVPSGRDLKSGLQAIRDEHKGMPAMTALENFSNIESHGLDVSALSEPAILTIEEAHPVAIELMDFIKRVDPDHFRKMKGLC